MLPTSQQGDPLLKQTLNDGDVSFENGNFIMTQTFETMVYLCLFGGNFDDDGRDGNPLTWWGNWIEPDPSRQYRSETQYILNTTNSSTEGLNDVKLAVLADLQVFLDENIASDINVTVTIPALNKVSIVATINANGEEQSFNYVENWKAAA